MNSNAQFVAGMRGYSFLPPQSNIAIPPGMPEVVVEVRVEANLQNLVDDLRKLVELQNKLLCCYRLGSRPSEKLLDDLQKYRERTTNP